mmetsp:Transcript_81790/g.128789  ORF Transcript_81790/g.128789 Transcript_81790/m.128789 type:complete len:93 (+) Transcript_81790:49-327(+)
MCSRCSSNNVGQEREAACEKITMIAMLAMAVKLFNVMRKSKHAVDRSCAFQKKTESQNVRLHKGPAHEKRAENHKVKLSSLSRLNESNHGQL